jgi:hypothetical protein
VTFRVDPNRLTTGTARLVIREPQVDTGTLAPAGTPTTLRIAETGSQARYTFDGTTGDRFALDVSAVDLVDDPANPSFLGLTVIGPSGLVELQGGTAPGQPTWLEFSGGLPETGTYTLVADVQGPAAGTVTITRVAPKVTTTPIAAGQSRTVTFARGDVRRLTFPVKAGQRPLLRFSRQTVTTGYRLLDPDGVLVNETFSQTDLSLQEQPKLARTGTYTVEIDPPGAETGAVTMRLDLVTDPVRTITPGAVVKASLQLAQNPELRFRVARGERVAVDLRSVAIAAGGSTAVLLHDQDGNTQAIGFVSDAGSVPQWLEAPSAATATGTWFVEVDGIGTATGSVSFVVRTAADHVLANRIGKSTSITIDRPVQNAVLPFAGPADFAGHSLSWSVTGSTFKAARLLVIGPFGVEATRDVPPGKSSGQLTVSGFSPATWQLMLDPVDGATGKATVRFTLT